MALNMKSLTQALAKTAAVIEKTVTTTVQEVTGPRPLQDYDLLSQIGSGGPGLAWKLYSAKPRGSAPSTQYPIVCVWVLDKRALSEARTKVGLSKTAEESFLDIVRADAAKLVRLRHPGVVHVVQALDESKNAMAMVTEPLFASVANALGNMENVDKVPKGLKGMEMSLLEVKHGLLQIAETLDFLHNNARLIHRAISPETVFITLSGSWKLGGFGFAISADQMSAAQPFHYTEYDIEDSVIPLQPSLNYTAPELVRSKELSIGCSSDMFSCGCLAYQLVARKPLLDCKNNVKMYMNTLTYLTSESFTNIPPDFLSDLRQLLSVDEAFRPSALDFTGSSFFRDDTRLRALRFLDHMLERNNMQKTEFLKALSDMWKDFDSRVLCYKVLPPLCAELRNMVMQPMILPMVLTIAKSQDKNDFELSTLPALVPVLSSASGETLLLLVKHAELIINKASNEYLTTHVLPLLIRAYDDTDAQIQEEVLQRTVSLVKQLDMQMVKQEILPRVHSLALRTTVAAVRVNALRCLSDVVPLLGKHEILDILQILQRCTAVDRSAPTLMCTLAVSNSIFNKHGIEFAVEHVIPLLFPLLTSQQLNVQQFAKYMFFIKDILRMIEGKRGVTVTESGKSENRVVSNGIQPEKIPQNIISAKGSSWDEDWGPVKKGVAKFPVTPDPNPYSNTEILVSHQTAIKADPFQPSVTVPDKQIPTCPAVDIVWPPPNPSSGFGSQSSGRASVEKEYQYAGGGPDVTFDDIDPFANWPPKPANTGNITISGVNSTPALGFSGLNSSNSGSLSNKNPIGASTQHKDISTNISRSNNRGLPSHYSASGSGNSLSAIGNLTTVSGTGSMNHLKSNLGQYNGRKDLESIFSRGSNEQMPLRIAPPPAAAAGRGRGKNEGHLRPPPRLQSNHTKPPNEQPSLLDLL